MCNLFIIILVTVRIRWQWAAATRLFAEKYECGRVQIIYFISCNRLSRPHIRQHNAHCSLGMGTIIRSPPWSTTTTPPSYGDTARLPISPSPIFQDEKIMHIHIHSENSFVLNGFPHEWWKDYLQNKGHTQPPCCPSPPGAISGCLPPVPFYTIRRQQSALCASARNVFVWRNWLMKSFLMIPRRHILGHLTAE